MAVARLGGRCAYAGVMGNDELSDFALAHLEHEGIDVSHVERKPSAAPVYSNIVVDQRRGSRNIFFDLSRAVGASLQTPAAFIQACRVLFIDHIGVPGMIRAARLARRAGIPVVADFETDADPRFQELAMALADHV